MQKTSWKLCEPCFIADTDSRRMRILPARVTCVLENGYAVGMSVNPSGLVGHSYQRGPAFPTKRAARTHARVKLAKYTSWLAAHLTRIPLEGTRPQLELPDHLPALGQTVYVINNKEEWVLEVAVGICRFGDFGWEMAYDSCPGNPESSMIRIKEWWPTREAAQSAARECYGKEFTFVTQETLAEEVRAHINKIWDDAAMRLKDPEWNRRFNDTMKELFPQVHQG